MSEVITVAGPRAAGEQARRDALPLAPKLGGAAAQSGVKRADSQPGVGVTVRLGDGGRLAGFCVVWAARSGFRIFAEFETAAEVAEFFEGFGAKPKSDCKQ